MLWAPSPNIHKLGHTQVKKCCQCGATRCTIAGMAKPIVLRNPHSDESQEKYFQHRADTQLLRLRPWVIMLTREGDNGRRTHIEKFLLPPRERKNPCGRTALGRSYCRRLPGSRASERLGQLRSDRQGQCLAGRQLRQAAADGAATETMMMADTGFFAPAISRTKGIIGNSL